MKITQTSWIFGEREGEWLLTDRGKEGGFEAGKVGQQDPVPASEEHVLRLDVAVADLLGVCLLQHLQQLEDDPLLLHVA